MLVSLQCLCFIFPQMLVDEWIEQYKSHKESALLSLMQFFINGSGCRGKITSSMANNMEHAAIIRKMTEEFDEVRYLTPQGTLGKGFSQRYSVE